MMVYEVFGSKLRLYREERGMSRRDLAEITGIKQNVITSYEQGDRGIKLDVAEKLAQGLGLTLSDFVIPDVKTPEDTEVNASLKTLQKDIKAVYRSGHSKQTVRYLEKMIKAITAMEADRRLDKVYNTTEFTQVPAFEPMKKKNYAHM